MRLSTPEEMDEQEQEQEREQEREQEQEQEQEQVGDSVSELGSSVAKQGERTGKQGKIPVEPGKRTGSLSKRTGSPGERTVSLFGSEHDLVTGVELLGEMLDQPEAFGLVRESRVGELAERVDELVEEKEQLRYELAVVWSHVGTEVPTGEIVIPQDGETGKVPASFDAEDPLAEFQDENGS